MAWISARMQVLVWWLLHVLLSRTTAATVQTGAVSRADGLCELLVVPYRSYNCQEYVVESQDGFLLGLQRISSKLYGGEKKGTVFLLHGFLEGGDIWVLSPPSEALAFVLADAGYDVWIGNTRTTRFSYGHVVYQRKDQGFWDWSVDELAEKDLPAMLGLVHFEAGQQIHYIGFSQGAQQLLAAFSEGLLLDLVGKVVLLAPVAYVTYTTAPAEVAIPTLGLDKFFEVAHISEFSTQTKLGRQIVDRICASTNMACYNDWIYLLSGENCCLNLTRRALVDKYETQATSTKNLAHFAQQSRRANFAKFDYGLLRNLQLYHSPQPPVYDLHKVPTGKMLLIHGEIDGLADFRDVQRLIRELVGNFGVALIPSYGHLDFVLASNARHIVYNRVVAFLGSS